MARIRTIKPEFFTSLTIAELSHRARLTFIGLWTHVDDEGRCVADGRLLKAAVWPLEDDVTADDVMADIAALSEASLITHYIVRERSFIAVNGWSEHQKINRPTASKLPAPSDGEICPPDAVSEASVSAHGGLTEASLAERKGKERNREQGKENPMSAAADTDTPDDVDEFQANFWEPYPRRANGSKGHRGKALRQWNRLTTDERQRAVVGMRHYTAAGQGPMDAHRFLTKTAGEYPFDQWQQQPPGPMNGTGKFADRPRGTRGGVVG